MLLTIGNSTSRIEGLSLAQLKDLKDVLSYSIDSQAAYFSSSFNRKRYLISKKGEFPTGLLYLVYDYFNKEALQVQTKDLRKRPQASRHLFNLNLGVTPYLEQEEAVEACIEHDRGVVSAVTGFGKSISMALLVHKLQLKTLIIVPNLQLKAQLSESFIKYFGSLNNITIENIDSSKLSSCKDYDCLIIDEAHHVAAKTYRSLNVKAWNSIFHRYFFTATPFRSREEEQILFESIAGQVIYRVSYKNAVDRGYIVPIEAYYFDLPTTKIDGHTWAQVYSQAVVRNSHRNELLGSLIASLKAQGASALCLVKEIHHGKEIARLTGSHFVKGENEDNQQALGIFNRGGHVMIGTIGVVSEGVDTRPCEWVIIAGLGKSKNSIMQQIGRGVRKYPGKDTCKIVIFRDRSHKFTLRHFKEQCKILAEEYGVIPTKLQAP